MFPEHKFNDKARFKAVKKLKTERLRLDLSEEQWKEWIRNNEFDENQKEQIKKKLTSNRFKKYFKNVANVLDNVNDLEEKERQKFIKVLQDSELDFSNMQLEQLLQDDNLDENQRKKIQQKFLYKDLEEKELEAIFLYTTQDLYEKMNSEPEKLKSSMDIVSLVLQATSGLTKLPVYGKEKNIEESQLKEQKEEKVIVYRVLNNEVGTLLGEINLNKEEILKKKDFRKIHSSSQQEEKSILETNEEIKQILEANDDIKQILETSNDIKQMLETTQDEKTSSEIIECVKKISENKNDIVKKITNKLNEENSNGKSFTSTAKRVESSYINGNWNQKDTLECITDIKTGHDIEDLSYHPEEEEVLFEPGARFQIEKISLAEGYNGKIPKSKKDKDHVIVEKKEI